MSASASSPPLAAAAGPTTPWWVAVLTVVVGAALVTAGSFAGWWWPPFALGVVLGAAGRLRAVPRARALLLPALAAVAGWAVPLLLLAAGGSPVGATSRTVAALAGLPAVAALPIGVTLLLAALQALAGTWLGRSLAPRR